MTLHTESFQAQKRGQQYTYAYDVHKEKRILKNLSVRLNGVSQETEYIMIFDYLSSREEIIDRMVLFMELAHYFINGCTMRPAIWYFVEGEPGLNYFMELHLKKRKQRFTNIDSIHIQLLDKRHALLLLTRMNRIRFEDVPIVDPDQMLSKVIKTKGIKKHKKIFCN